MKKISPAVITFLLIWIIALISFQVIGYGFMPPDDAMRHSAKIISEKEWSQILILRDEIKLDSYPGWHVILGFVHRVTGWDQHSLVIFSVIALFTLFCSIPLFFLKFPGSWLLSVVTISIMVPGWILRLFLGRPYMVTMAALLLILLIYPRLNDKKLQNKNIAILTCIIGISIWMHASWYFFLFLIIPFALARQWRASALLAISSGLGIFIGASLTGHPVLFLKQMLIHLFLVFGSNDVERQLVGELRPMIGDYSVILTILMMLGWRRLRGAGIKKSVDNPIFIFIVLAFVLGLISRRFWLDWGMTAFAVWMAKEFEEFLESKIGLFPMRNFVLTAMLALVLYISITTDAGSRWSLNRPMDYVSENDPEQAKWLPASGGIIYSDDMSVFYQIFYRNPRADWRYILGFESSFMPPEDLKILRNIQRNFGRPEDFEPWVKKMRPKDRLIVRGGPGSEPKIKGLEWHYIALNMWIGKKPKDMKI